MVLEAGLAVRQVADTDCLLDQLLDSLSVTPICSRSEVMAGMANYFPMQVATMSSVQVMSTLLPRNGLPSYKSPNHFPLGVEPGSPVHAYFAALDVLLDLSALDDVL